MQQQGARSRHQQSNKKDELDSGRRAKRVYLRQNILDKYGRTAGCPGCLGIGQHTEECRARTEQEMVAASCKDFGILVIDISVAFMHARTDEEIYVKVPSGIKSSKILESQGSSKWNEESIKALARVLI